MLDKRLRQVKEQMLAPVARWCGEDVTPIQITLMSGIVGILSAVAGWQGLYVIGLGLWLLNRVLDGLDGTVARLFNQQSDIGAYIDILVDDTVYALVPFGIAVSIGTLSVYLALIFMLATFYVNTVSWAYLSALLEKRNRGAIASGEMTTVTMPDGLIEGTETIIFFALFFLLPHSLIHLFVIMGVLVIVTIIQRLIWALRYLD